MCTHYHTKGDSENMSMKMTMWTHLPPKRSMTQSRKRQTECSLPPDQYDIDPFHSFLYLRGRHTTTRYSTAPSRGSSTSQNLMKTMWLVRKTAGGGGCIVCSMVRSPGRRAQHHRHPSPAILLARRGRLLRQCRHCGWAEDSPCRTSSYTTHLARHSVQMGKHEGHCSSPM